MFVSVREVKAVIGDSCIDNGSCVVLCSYDTESKKKKSLTIYYEFDRETVHVKWEGRNGYVKASSPIYNGSFNYVRETLASPKLPVIWKSSANQNVDIKKNFVCPKNAYLSLDYGGALCFDNDKTCAGKHKLEGHNYSFKDEVYVNNYELKNSLGNDFGDVNKENLDKNKNDIIKKTEGTLDIDMDFDTSKGCESYLGNPKFVSGKDYQDPAYYLQFVFNLMKYAALILLFVFTAVEFGKAMVNNNQDAMKKAIANTIKRLIIAIIIFFLPVLIEFILQLLGIYQQDGCGIS